MQLGLSKDCSKRHNVYFHTRSWTYYQYLQSCLFSEYVRFLSMSVFWVCPFSEYVRFLSMSVFWVCLCSEYVRFLSMSVFWVCPLSEHVRFLSMSTFWACPFSEHVRFLSMSAFWACPFSEYVSKSRAGFQNHTIFYFVFTYFRQIDVKSRRYSLLKNLHKHHLIWSANVRINTEFKTLILIPNPGPDFMIDGFTHSGLGIVWRHLRLTRTGSKLHFITQF